MEIKKTTIYNKGRAIEQIYVLDPHKVKVINFPGGTSEKITDQLDDLIKGKPVDLIANVGTNDIANNVNLWSNVKNIFRKVCKDSP